MNMKHISLFLTLLMILVTGFRSSAQDIRSSELFENITDIEKLVHQNVSLPQQSQTSSVTTPNISNNSKQYKDSSFVKLNVMGGLTSLDSLYFRNENGTLQLPTLITNEIPTWMTLRDTIIVDPLFLPIVFNGVILPDDLKFFSTDDNFKNTGTLISADKTFALRLAHADFMRNRRLDYYRTYPDRIKYSILDFDNEPMIGSDKDVLESYNPFKELISTETSFSLKTPTVDGANIKRKYWTRNGDHALQFSQNYFSPNWHKGGTNNFNIINRHTLRFNYKKNKIRFNNTIEARLALMTAPDDSVRNYRISDDLLRYTADFGIDAFGKHWSYSTNIDTKTQFFPNYPTNSTKAQSAFFAPLYASGGIGLKYNLDKKSEKVRHRRVRLSFNFDPASVSFRYVGRDDIDIKRYGIEEGKKHKLDLGSTITGNLIFDFNKYISLNSRMRYFTSYHKVEGELENTLNMALTNAFSTSLFIHLRFDDGVPADPKFKYLQVTELLSFGLNYKW